jgi:hypothetical protein
MGPRQDWNSIGKILNPMTPFLAYKVCDGNMGDSMCLGSYISMSLLVAAHMASLLRWLHFFPSISSADFPHSLHHPCNLKEHSLMDFLQGIWPYYTLHNIPGLHSKSQWKVPLSCNSSSGMPTKLAPGRWWEGLLPACAVAKPSWTFAIVAFDYLGNWTIENSSLGSPEW